MPVVNTGAESNGISAHGTIIKRNGTAIAELNDISSPELSRKDIETSTHNSDDDSYVVGIRRKGVMKFDLNFLPSGEATHNAVAGLLKAWADGSKDRYDLLFPDGAQWIFSGFVTKIASTEPVDDKLGASVEVRPSGGQVFLP